MNNTYTIIEKAISVFLIISGIFLLYFSLDFLFEKIDLVLRSNNNSYSGLSEYYYDYFKDFHLVIIFSVIAVISGIFLMKNNRFGWLTAIIVLIGFPINVLLRNWLNPESDIRNPSNSTLIVIGITILVSLIGVFLFAKPFRKKYLLQPKHWKYISIALIIIIIDVYVFKQ